jgi:hypothetical protein
MEIQQCEVETVVKKRRAILDRTTFLEKGIQILDLQQFMWTQMKQNYDKHVKQMENLKDIAKEEDYASKARLVPLFLMRWEALMLDVMLEFLNTFLIKGAYIYFGHEDKAFVINKQLIVDVFGVCAKGYVEQLNG